MGLLEGFPGCGAGAYGRLVAGGGLGFGGGRFIRFFILPLGHSPSVTNTFPSGVVQWLSAAKDWCAVNMRGSRARKRIMLSLGGCLPEGRSAVSERLMADMSLL